MIDFELAKELKAAGWPQTFPMKDGFYNSEGKFIETKVNDGSTWAYTEFTSGYASPTLEELIEACGNRVGFFRISDTECNAWKGEFPKADPDEVPQIFTGSTPTEAVARLWLALQNHGK